MSKQYTDEQLQENYNKFIDMLNVHFSGDRLDKLLHMYSQDELGIELAIAPASGKLHFHSAYRGGYIDHVMNVVKNALMIKKLFVHGGGILEHDFSDEELVFAAFHHDLGKLGNGTQSYYLPQQDKWFQEKKNEFFKHNPNLQYFDVTDRAIWLLNQYGIKFTEREMLGIMLADGLFNEQRKKYWVSYSEDFQLKTELPYLLHWADWMSCRQEHTQWNQISNI